MGNLRKAWMCARYFMSARNMRGFGIHSPYLYEFVQQVICNRHPYYCFARLEAMRRMLLHDDSVVYVKDYGTGVSGEHKVSSIARRSLASPRYAQMLFRMAVYTKSKRILELGTSLGLTACYLASSGNVHCTTVEGSEKLVEIAKKIARKFHLNNIRFLCGNLDELLDSALRTYGPFDMVYFDANHTEEATLRYFEMALQARTEESIFVFDDIRASEGMSRAWNVIRHHKDVTASVDVYRLGVVFFSSRFKQKTYYVKR